MARLARQYLHSRRAAMRRTRRGLRELPTYMRNYRRWRRMPDQAPIGRVRLEPQLFDRTALTGFDAHYVIQGPWAFEQVSAHRPALHVDVGSYVGYLGFFAALVRTTFVDIRPARLPHENLSVVSASVTALPFRDSSLPSVSCLHVIEHVGLGRYGDPLDPNGTAFAAEELCRVLAPDGRLYVSLPVGDPAVYFDAHRVHSLDQVTKLFRPLRLLRADAVLDDGQFVRDIDQSVVRQQRYGCGLLTFGRDS